MMKLEKVFTPLNVMMMITLITVVKSLFGLISQDTFCLCAVVTVSAMYIREGFKPVTISGVDITSSYNRQCQKNTKSI